MAKTMFGIPGVNDKNTGGAPIAPQGAGTGATAHPPETAVAAKPAAVTPAASVNTTAPPMVKMAAPVTAPSAVAPEKKPAQAARTVFGMPAIKLPVAAPAAPPAAASEPTPEPASVGAPVAETPVEATAAPAAPPDDAFKATMLGMPAMSLESLQTDGVAAASNNKPVEEARDTEPSPEEKIASSAAAPLSAQTTPVTLTAPASSAAVQSSGTSSSNTAVILAIVAGVVMFVATVAFAAWFLFIKS